MRARKWELWWKLFFFFAVKNPKADRRATLLPPHPEGSFTPTSCRVSHLVSQQQQQKQPPSPDAPVVLGQPPPLAGENNNYFGGTRRWEDAAAGCKCPVVKIHTAAAQFEGEDI